MRALASTTFASLAIPNYRRWFVGQTVSLAGTWMQMVAQSWLVLELTGSGTALGLIVAVQTLPTLLLGPYAGVLADRVDRRRWIMLLQSLMGLCALVLGLLTVSGAIVLWEVYAIAGCLGVATALEFPARQAFILEIVGRDSIRNAVGLNAVLVSVARSIGPAIAGLLIAGFSIGACFLVNAVSYIAVIASLALMDRGALQPHVRTERAKGQLRDGLRYVRHAPALLVPLLMMTLIGTLAFEFQVVLPVLAKGDFHGNAATYGFMTAAMGLGAVVGGLVTAGRGRTGIKAATLAALLFGACILLAATAPSLPIVLLALTLVGACGVSFVAVGNATLQVNADDAMRGRVMALWSVAFIGTTPIGGPIVGLVVEAFGGRAGLLVGSAACFAAAALALAIQRRAARLAA